MTTTPTPANTVVAQRIRSVIIAGRVALGTAMMLNPTLSTKLYLGADAHRPGLRYYVRIAGGREIALAASLHLVADQPTLRRRTLMLGSAFDVWDATDAIITRGLPRHGRLIAATAALTWALLGAAAATLDDQADSNPPANDQERQHRDQPVRSHQTIRRPGP